MNAVPVEPGPIQNQKFSKFDSRALLRMGAIIKHLKIWDHDEEVLQVRVWKISFKNNHYNY